MSRPSAKDWAMIIASSAIGAAVGLMIRLPKLPDENNMLGLVGSLIGAAIAVIAGLLVLARQFETSDERHLRTIRQLLQALNDAGGAMTALNAVNDPVRHVKRAFSALAAAKSVTRELQAAGPHVAAVAQMLDESDVNGQLIRLSQPNIGIAAADLNARGGEVVALANAASQRLNNGL